MDRSPQVMRHLPHNLFASLNRHSRRRSACAKLLAAVALAGVGFGLGLGSQAALAADATTNPSPASDSAGLSGPLGGVSNPGTIVLKDQQDNSPILLNQEADYILDNVRVIGLVDQAALTLNGSIRSVTMKHCRIGDVLAGGSAHAAGMEALGASVRSLSVSDSVFYNCENQLVSLKEGSFGVVTFDHCVFKNSDAFLKGVYTNNPARTSPPVAEFYNIDRLELLDDDFENTTIVIHPSVKTVVFRGDISHLQIESPDTQVLRLAPGESPTDYAQANPQAAPTDKPQDSAAQPAAPARSDRSASAAPAAKSAVASAS